MPVEFHKVSKRYEDKEVLRDLDLFIPDTGVCCLTGPSGAGKTTVLRLIAGLEQPDSGTISGTSAKKISMVFQNDRLLPGSSATENIALVSSPEDAALWLERMELTDAANKKPSKLSGGMRRRVALARALAYGGDILLLDEPFKGFDPALKQRILPYITAFAKTAAVVLVTHDEQESALAETCLMIKKL